MDIKFEKLSDYQLEDFGIKASWDSDLEIKHFLSPNLEGLPLENVSGKFLLERAKQNKNKYYYMIMHITKPIGVVTITKNFPELASRNDNTAWISIYIGEKRFRDRDIGKKAMALSIDM